MTITYAAHPAATARPNGTASQNGSVTLVLRDTLTDTPISV